MAKKFIILDTETTGLEVHQGHRIIEIGAVLLNDRKKSEEHFHTYINPTRLIDEEASKVHGIMNEDLIDKPLFEDIAEEFLEFIDGSTLVIHNAAFDVGFLNHELSACGKESIKNKKVDTVSIAREKFPGQSVSLDALCKRFSIDNTEREIHSATIDTELLARVYIELMDARELSLDLNVKTQHTSSESNFDIQKIQNRELATRLTDDDKELHKTFVETLGENAIWKKKEQYNNE